MTRFFFSVAWIKPDIPFGWSLSWALSNFHSFSKSPGVTFPEGYDVTVSTTRQCRPFPGRILCAVFFETAVLRCRRYSAVYIAFQKKKKSSPFKVRKANISPPSPPSPPAHSCFLQHPPAPLSNFSPIRNRETIATRPAAYFNYIIYTEKLGGETEKEGENGGKF